MSRCRVRRWLVTIAAAVAATAVAAPMAEATGDLSISTMVCAPANGHSTRRGEDVLCHLNARSPDWTVGVNADVTIPAATRFIADDPMNAGAVPNDPDNPTSIHFDPSQLGFLSPWQFKSVDFLLRVRETGVSVGDPITPVATLRAADAPDATATANTLNVMPPPPDLTPSTMSCADVGDPPVRPGDTVECSMQLINDAGREDAADVRAQATLPGGATWAPGGNELSHAGVIYFWDVGSFPDGVRSGPPSAPTLRFRAQISPDLLGGVTLFFLGYAQYEGALSTAPGDQGLAASIVLAPGPAVLTPSSLTCTDRNGDPLYPGDTIDCKLSAAIPSGYEEIGNVTGVANVPLRTKANGSTGDINVVMGNLKPGGIKNYNYTLVVDDSAPAGTTVTPTASLGGRSQPSDTPVSIALTADTFTVVAKPAQPVAAAAALTDEPGPDLKGGNPVKPASRICGSRRVVVVNVNPPKHQHWKSVTFSWKGAKKKVTGKLVAKGRLRQRGTFRARLVFQGLPKGPLKVNIVGKTKRGKTVKRERNYKLCTPKGR